MNAKQAIQTALQQSKNLMQMYLADLSDSDLLIRPVPGANHIAWQLGHIIASEASAPYFTTPPELPAGWKEQHGKEAHTKDTGFATKATYLELFNKVRQATLDAVERMPDADLEKKIEGRMAQMVPTWGAFAILMAQHAMMHAGQFTVVRRKLGKPVVL